MEVINRADDLCEACGGNVANHETEHGIRHRGCRAQLFPTFQPIQREPSADWLHRPTSSKEESGKGEIK
jgi:hypothetical protein